MSSRRSSSCLSAVSSFSGSCQCSESVVSAAAPAPLESALKRPPSGSATQERNKMGAESTELRQPPRFSSMEHDIDAMPPPASRFDAASSVGAASTVSSNPSNWEGHFARKMLDMQWYFSANPLRVTDCSGRQWTRLHATSKEMIPQPGGKVLMLKQRIPYVTDEELCQRVLSSGVAVLKKDRKLPPLPLRRDLSTPELRAKTIENIVPPLPRRPSKAPSTVASGGSSCFSSSVITGAKLKTSSVGGRRSTTSSSRSSSRLALQELEKGVAEERAATELYSRKLDEMQSSLDALQAIVERGEAAHGKQQPPAEEPAPS